MSQRLGMVQYGDNNEYIFLGREMIRSKDYSEQTAEEIDAEVKRLIDEGNSRAKALIEANRDKLEVVAKALLEYETLEGAQVEEIIRTGKFIPREPLPDAAPPAGPASAPALPEASKPTPPPLGAGLGHPAPATV
jgi:cell division protease FtsH